MSKVTEEISRHMQGIMQGIDTVITEIAGERVGFTLIIYTDERASYASSIDRETAICELKKLIECWESGMEDIPAHLIN